MTEPTNEPENYSIDDMMGRLKSSKNSDQKGELVTRADGSKALKVRKRKRRTSQKTDKFVRQNQRVQLIQIAGFIVFLVVLLLVAGLGVVYANSPGFRKSLVSKVDKVIGGEMVLSRFRVNPANANAQKVTIQWPSGHVLERLEVYYAAAEISPISFLGKDFKGEEVVANWGFLSLKNPREGKEKTYEADKGIIDFGRYSVPQLDLFFGAERRWNQALKKTEASFYPSSVKGHGEIRLNNGLLTMPDWPELELDRAYISVDNDSLHIRSMSFQIPEKPNQKLRDRGSIGFSGSIELLDPDATHSLAVSLESFKLKYLLGEDFGQLFKADVMTLEDEGLNLLQVTPKEDGEASLELHVTNSLDSQIELSDFKFLGFLARTLDDSWYENPIFDSRVSLTIKRNGNDVQMTDISFEERGRMSLRGNISSGQGGRLSGDLRVGIPEAILEVSKNPRINAMFTTARGGYRWIDLKINGTGVAPQDDFKQLYTDAVPAGEDDQTGSDLEESTPDTFDSLIQGQ